MAHDTTFGDNPVGDLAGAIKDLPNRARDIEDSLADMAKSASDKVKQGRGSVAGRMADAASTVHDRADQLPGGPKVQEFAHAAADRLSTSADYVRTHDVSRMMSDVEGLVRRNPGPALAIAAAFGFLLGRALARD